MTTKEPQQYIHIDTYGDKFIYKDRDMTILHCLEGPAIEYANGIKVWYVDGKRHRTDGAALEYANGTKYWYVNDKLHRTDGPAVERADGYKAWYVNDKFHRTDGPAIEYANGDKVWYINDKCLTENEFKALTAPTLELTLNEIASKFGVDVSKLKITK